MLLNATSASHTTAPSITTLTPNARRLNRKLFKPLTINRTTKTNPAKIITY